jgi:hydrogenase maturation protease
MTKILVIGYGNPLCGDDGVGIATVKALQEKIRREDCVFVTQHQPYPETVTLLKDASHVIFIDASIGGVPGEIERLPLSSLDYLEVDEVMSHHLTPEWMLWMTERLYGHRPQGMMFTIAGQEFGVGEGFSDCVIRRLPHLIEIIETHIAENLLELQPVN